MFQTKSRNNCHMVVILLSHSEAFCFDFLDDDFEDDFFDDEAEEQIEVKEI